MWRSTILIGATAAVISLCGVASAGTDAEDEGIVSVWAYPPVSSEPGWIELVIRFHRDDANRALLVEVDSLDLFRSSLISLDGDSAPAIHWLHFTSLPAGRYTVRVTLHRDGQSVSTATNAFIVDG